MVFNLFKTNKFEKLKEFYQGILFTDKMQKYQWLSLAVNQRTISGSMLTKEFVLSTDKTNLSIQLGQKENSLNAIIYDDGKKIYTNEITDVNEIEYVKNSYNEAFEKLIKSHLDIFTSELNKGDFSPLNIEAETKALEWLRVSFEVLSRAIVESMTNPDYLFQMTLFSGINPKTNHREMRIICFNLDMTFILLPDSKLRAIIYNKTPQTKQADLRPALIGDYTVKKREIFDHLITLLGVLSKGIHC